MKGEVNILQKEGETGRVLGQEYIATCQGGQRSQRRGCYKGPALQREQAGMRGLTKAHWPCTGVPGDFNESVMLGVVGHPTEGKNPGQQEDVALEKWVSRSLAMATGDGTPAQGRGRIQVGTRCRQGSCEYTCKPAERADGRGHQ